MKLDELEDEGPKVVKHPISDPCRLLPMIPGAFETRVRVKPKDGSQQYHLIVIQDENDRSKVKYAKQYADGHLGAIED